LAHTNEFIGGKHNITTKMQARSSLGRNFIEVCKCAGWGDVGYVNRWTMEITNNSRNLILALPVNKRVAQIVFLRTEGEVDEEHSYGVSGKYQTGEETPLWDPSMMLPRLWLDSSETSKSTIVSPHPTTHELLYLTSSDSSDYRQETEDVVVWD
jgi:dCTP deaminase